MNSHNPKTETIVRIASDRIITENDEVRLIKSNLIDAPELAISEDCDPGSDPYNNTGQHFTLKAKFDLQD